ncbi:MAG: hypothetical protein A3F46_03260 [Legionellales bacterium RIFCSPHIGHO2_12_FULL_42_9]|nr:MAG: hypothetical protein A3F46_03260 [Legionellales bacterium RIFCSPHIGHO2_12_FULL_42_9]
MVATADIIRNIADNMRPIQKLVTGFAYLLGIGFAFKALLTLKAYGEAKTMMSSHASMKEPFVYFIVAGFLLFFPSGLDVMLNTMFGNSSILAYHSMGSEIDKFGQSVVLIMQTLGLVAFVRGWVLIARSASSGGGQPGSIGKGLTHVIGGILAINIVQTINIIYNTIGL